MTTQELSLNSRYSIRPLRADDLQYVKALLAYNMVFHNMLYRPVYTRDLTRRLYTCFHASEPVYRHSIASGYSIGVFDNDFEYKWPESRAKGGQILWNFNDEPLLPHRYVADRRLLGTAPMVPAVYRQFQARDHRDPGSWKATGPGQVLARNGTATRPGYEGRGLAKAGAHALMRKCAEDGFRAIQVESVADAVTRIWMNPPPHFRTDPICEFEVYDQTDVDEQGNVTYPFRPARLKAWRGYCHLK